MQQDNAQPGAEVSEAAPPAQSLIWPVFKVLWLSIFLGIGMEIYLLLTDAIFARYSPTTKVIADSVRQVTWSSFVCVGLAVGAGATRLRPLLTGIAGLFAAPLAFGVARIVHGVLVQVLPKAGSAMAIPLALTVGVIKGAEYALLGLLIALLARKPGRGPFLYALTGAVVGGMFGSCIALASRLMSATPPPITTSLVQVGNEVIFNIGCATILYLAGILSRYRL